jgi:hypothetical protein
VALSNGLWFAQANLLRSEAARVGSTVELDPLEQEAEDAASHVPYDQESMAPHTSNMPSFQRHGVPEAPPPLEDTSVHMASEANAEPELLTVTRSGEVITGPRAPVAIWTEAEASSDTVTPAEGVVSARPIVEEPAWVGMRPGASSRNNHTRMQDAQEEEHDVRVHVRASTVHANDDYDYDDGQDSDAAEVEEEIAVSGGPSWLRIGGPAPAAPRARLPSSPPATTSASAVPASARPPLIQVVASTDFDSTD